MKELSCFSFIIFTFESLFNNNSLLFLKILSLASGSPSTLKLHSKVVFKKTKLSANGLIKLGGPIQFQKKKI